MEPVVPQHALRPPADVLDSLKKALAEFKAMPERAWRLAVLVDTELAEIRERKLYKTAFGYTSFDTFIKEELGFHPSHIRRRIARAQRTMAIELGHANPKGTQGYPVKLYDQRGDILPNPPPGRVLPQQGVVPIKPKGKKRPPIPVASIEQAVEVLSADAPEEVAGVPQGQPALLPSSGHPLIGWLVRTLDQLDPRVVVDQGTDDELTKIVQWVDEFIAAGEAKAFCEHHPDARSEDGKTCEACGQRVKV